MDHGSCHVCLFGACGGNPISFRGKRSGHRSMAEERSGVRVRIYSEGLAGFFVATFQNGSAATHLSDR
jgi:hypothetical protein